MPGFQLWYNRNTAFGLYLKFPSSDYCMMLDRLKASLNEEQWEAYRRAHPDLMKIYREQGEEGNTVVVGYRFK